MPRKAKARAVGVGIDVSKRELAVCVRREGGALERSTVANDAAGVRRLARGLAGCACPIVTEATSHYGWLAAVSLVEAGLDARVINPILAVKYTKSGVRMVKSDPADAATLALMAERDGSLPPTFALSREALAWRKEYGLFETLKRKCAEARKAIAGAREALACVGVAPSAGLAAAEASLKALDSAARKAEASLAARAAELSGGLAGRMSTVPGVSASMAGLACQLLAVGEGRDSGSWVAYAGLDVSVRQSGEWRGRSRLTKRGSATLRRRLFCCAWGAVRHDAAFRAAYDGLRESGRSYVEALVIVARKLVRILFEIASGRSESYDASLAWPARKPASA